MTHHADKVVPAAATSDADVVMAASHACSDCGGQAALLAATAAAGVS
jgi:hypothetical protein